MKDNFHLYKLIITFFICLLLCQCSTAQESAGTSNEYYISYPDNLTLRLYVARKFAPFTISSNATEDLNYKTNSKLNLGAGFTYKFFTLNLSYGFNFLNKDNGRGDTKGLDLQLHIYPKNWAVDLLGSFLKGYYLDPKANNGLSLTEYYKRPDISRNIIGLSVFRVANANRFSYKAAFTQNAWQTKSAGTLLFGASAYYGVVNADSAFVPSAAGSDYKQAGVNKINFFTIGPGIGYAYTLVLSRHFYVTGSVIGIANVNISTEEYTIGNDIKTKILPGSIYKAAIGYNSSTWGIVANLLGNVLYTASTASYKEYYVPTGVINFVITKKIGTGRR